METGRQNRPLTVIRQTLAGLGIEAAAMRLSLALKYNPRWHLQPRVPRGNPDGGQWTDNGGVQVANLGPIVFPVLKEGGKRALRLAAPRVRTFLDKIPDFWSGNDEFPSVDEFDEETRRIGPFTPRRPQHEFHWFKSWREFKDWLGPADPGWEWHHIVEQRLARKGVFAPERIHNTDNIVMLPLEVHRCISDTMSKKLDRLSPVMRFVIEMRPYWIQYNQGLKLIETCLEREGYELDSFRW